MLYQIKFGTNILNQLNDTILRNLQAYEVESWDMGGRFI